MESNSPAPKRSITFYSKPGCHLCDEGFERVQAVAAKFDLAVTKVDIHTRPELLAAHGERIPVVEFDGRELCWGRISEKRLERELRRLNGPGKNEPRSH